MIFDDFFFFFLDDLEEFIYKHSFMFYWCMYLFLYQYPTILLTVAL